MFESSLKKLAFGFSVISTLAACGTQNITELHGKSISSTTLTGSAVEEYRKFVAFEANEMMDWTDASYFAAKALNILQNPEALQPEDYREWNIDERFLAEISTAENRLRMAMHLIGSSDEPKALATAITSFDCWIEQAEEGWQNDHIAACKDAFNGSIRSIEEQIGVKITDAGDAKARFIVYHDFNQPQPVSEDFVLLRSFPPRNWRDLRVHVHVRGHADRSGSEAYNETLSVSRTLTVVNEILTAWPLEYTLSIEGQGERNPALKTPDGVANIHNRRSEIEVTLVRKAHDEVTQVAQN